MCVVCAARQHKAPACILLVAAALLMDGYLMAVLSLFAACMAALDHKQFTLAAACAVVMVVWHLV